MSTAPYDGADLVKLRKAATKLAKDGDLPPRVNMSLPDKRNKIPVFDLTKDPAFDLNGFSEYGKLRRAAFEHFEAGGIYIDLLFNLFKSDIEGLIQVLRFGGYNFGDKTIDPNPYGLTMVECEREANQILWAMIPDPESPPGIELQLIERKNLPILSFFATYDQVFLNRDDERGEKSKDLFEDMKFDNDVNPRVMHGLMKGAKLKWEIDAKIHHEPWEDLTYLLKAIRRGNMRTVLRAFVDKQKRKWVKSAKDIDDPEQREELKSVDVKLFLNKMYTVYDHLVEDGEINPARPSNLLPPRQSKPIGRIKSNAASADVESEESMVERFLSEHSDAGFSPESFISMVGTKSGQTVDGDKVQQGKKPPRRVPKRPAGANKNGNEGKTKKVVFASYTDDEECRRRDEERARKEALAQKIACRRKRFNKLGDLITCLEEHLSNHCPHVIKSNLAVAKLHPMHPFNPDSPIDNYGHWMQYAGAEREYDGFPSYEEAKKMGEAQNASAYNMVDMIVVLLAIFSFFIMAWRSGVISPSQSLSTDSVDVNLSSGLEGFFSAQPVWVCWHSQPVCRS